ncbi:hypothetical protein EXIGLDRAFT_760859 [Exidia glandulosa HHB12029]|uniref:lytic cellulose monooxygenase (C4-dehydrogenating) n=1 Tax=Exidia glandulosa HHB12029 TaxID=1314781 RepID=A0A165NXK9_EXIGL|nr:hypothetical protein EXIGLDRAFT_760859 [Exidia glandulosa HHB12029]
MKLSYAFVAAACASFVSAHGVVQQFTANGKDYAGPGPLEEDGPAMPESPIRRVGILGPVTDVTSTEMACGTGNPGPVNGIAQVDAGSEVKFKMSPWVHRIGPLTTYMGKCPDTPDKCDPNSLKWFKVDAKALKEDGKTWYHGDLADGKPGVATIPAGLEEGYYLLRYEILALHKAVDLGMAEFFISCTQIQVTNGGTSTPSDSQLVSFPGAYTAEDPGIHVDVYTNFNSYSYPGPELFDGTNGGSGSGGGEAPIPPPPPPIPTTTEPAPTSTEPAPVPTSTEPAPVPEPTSTEPAPVPVPTSTEAPVPEPTSTDPAPVPTPTAAPPTCKRKVKGAKRAVKREEEVKAKAKREEMVRVSNMMHRRRRFQAQSQH